MAYQHFFSGLLPNHTADISKIGCTYLADKMHEITTKTIVLIQQRKSKEKNKQLLKPKKQVQCKLSISYFPIPSARMV